jgi:tetratricopeptide (TPR) repeat protein
MDLSNLDPSIIKKIKEADKLSKPGGTIMKKIRDLFDYTTINITNANVLYTDVLNELMMTEHKNANTWHLILELRDKRTKNLIKLEDYFELYNEYAIIGKILLKNIKNYSGSIKNYLLAINYCKLTGNLKRVQDLYITIAEIYDKNLMDYEKSIEYYTKAVEIDDNSSVHKIYIEIARLNITISNFQEAQKNYEKAGEICIGNPLLHWNIKDIYCMATLCGICLHSSNFKEDYENYKQQYSKFNDTIENKLIEGILESFEQRDINVFVRTITEYDKITGKLDSATKLLLTIRRMIENQDEDELR